MTELHITPQMPAYPKIANDVFLMLLDGKLRSRTETLKFLKPLAPPPPLLHPSTDKAWPRSQGCCGRCCYFRRGGRQAGR